MTIDSADDSKISNRTINTKRILNRTYDSKSNQITKLRRSLVKTTVVSLLDICSDSVADIKNLENIIDLVKSVYHSHDLTKRSKYHHHHRIVVTEICIICWDDGFHNGHHAIMNLWWRHTTASGNRFSWSHRHRCPTFSSWLVWQFSYRNQIRATDRQTKRQTLSTLKAHLPMGRDNKTLSLLLHVALRSTTWSWAAITIERLLILLRVARSVLAKDKQTNRQKAASLIHVAPFKHWGEGLTSKSK